MLLIMSILLFGLMLTDIIIYSLKGKGYNNIFIILDDLEILLFSILLFLSFLFPYIKKRNINPTVRLIVGIINFFSGFALRIFSGFRSDISGGHAIVLFILRLSFTFISLIVSASNS